MNLIDLRSDGVARPSDGMRAAIAAAPVGDDQFEDDPTVNQLQEVVASLLGKEASLWLPTGTMANQVALKVLTQPGDDVIVSRESHAAYHETGGSAANAGVQFTAVGDQGTFTVDDFEGAVKPREHAIYPPTTLVEIENTHNRAGGIIFPQAEAKRICGAARNHGIASYLDGARIWNTAIATQTPPAELAAPFDLAMVSLSKGLGVPGGSMLAGPRDLIKRAVRYRRMYGGAMRQIGFFAAAGLYALEHNMERLAIDHENAQFMANRLAESTLIDLDVTTVQTNILVFRLKPDAPDSYTVTQQAQADNILISPFDARTIRLVTHLDTSTEQCTQAADRLVTIIESNAA